MMRESEKVYSDIYDIVQENIEAAGEKFPSSKAAFLYSVSRHPEYADVFDLAPMDNESFIQSLYVGLFNRTMDDAAREDWDKRTDMEREDFQAEAVQRLAASQEYLQSGKVFKDNVYSSPSREFSVNISGAGGGGSYEDKLYHIYMRLPAWLKNLAKRILARMR